ncbi:MAG TPA: RNA degradosome polyphosphate kinase, partial [Polyangiaceae bacterium]|nr:RNA degradosome polyphosphate kinase [Polyangiaceae bacterium]
DVIDALYLAGQAGVKIELLVRGICCLRPQVPGLSENIVVHAVIDRFLEHARIFLFENDGKHDLFCGSADWMPRNFRRRVEVMFPILDPELKARVRDEILAVMARDNAKSWVLGSDGRYTRADWPSSAPRTRSQEQFVEDARACAHRRSPGIQATEFQVPGDPPSPLGKLRRPPKNRVR